MKRFSLLFTFLVTSLLIASCSSKNENAQLDKEGTVLETTIPESITQTDMPNQEHILYGLTMTQDDLQINATISGLNLKDSYLVHENTVNQSIYLYSWGITFGDYFVVMGFDAGSANDMDSIETFEIPASLWKKTGDNINMIDPNVGVSVSISEKPNSDQISFFISPQQNMDLSSINNFSLEIVEDGAVVYTQQYSSDEVIASNESIEKTSETIQSDSVTKTQPASDLDWSGEYTSINNPSMTISITGSMESGYHIEASESYLTSHDVTKESISANVMVVFTEMDNNLIHELKLEGNNLTYQVTSPDPAYQEKFGYQSAYTLND